MAKIFDREDEPNDFMEMPCRCDCGKWFDLNDGYSSEKQKNKVICGECGETEEKEIEREEQITDWKSSYDNAKYDMESAAKELKKLGVDVAPLQPLQSEEALWDEAFLKIHLAAQAYDRHHPGLPNHKPWHEEMIAELKSEFSLSRKIKQ
jgi:hypothetical protein